MERLAKVSLYVSEWIALLFAKNVAHWQKNSSEFRQNLSIKIDCTLQNDRTREKKYTNGEICQSLLRHLWSKSGYDLQNQVVQSTSSIVEQ